MTYRGILTGISITLLSMIVVGCAGPATETGVRLTDAAATSSLATKLCGTWQGYFWYVAGDHTSSSGSSNLTLEVAGDSTYTLKWGNRPLRTGTVATRGKHVILQDASGSELSLVSSRDTLYGMTKDSANGRATMINLEKQESVPSQYAATSPRC